MPQFLFGILLLIGTVLGLRWLARANPATLARVIRRLLTAAGAVAGIGVLLAILFRAPGFLFSLLMFGMPIALWIWRNYRARAGLGKGWQNPGTSSSSGGNASIVETSWLRMRLDHDSGGMDGTVLRGAFAGRGLDDLGEPVLVDLLSECAADADSVRVLEAYLDRRFGPSWRARRPAGGQGGAGDAEGVSAASMATDEAYAILGLKPGATPDEIRAAHRRLMQANHPDRGGSDWLAARINRARDVLLGE